MTSAVLSSALTAPLTDTAPITRHCSTGAPQSPARHHSLLQHRWLSARQRRITGTAPITTSLPAAPPGAAAGPGAPVSNPAWTGLDLLKRTYPPSPPPIPTQQNFYGMLPVLGLGLAGGIAANIGASWLLPTASAALALANQPRPTLPVTTTSQALSRSRASCARACRTRRHPSRRPANTGISPATAPAPSRANSSGCPRCPTASSSGSQAT